MKRLISITIITVLIFLLCGCSPKITEGEVYKKEYRKAHTNLVVIPYVTSNGKTTHTTMIPYFIYYPDRYVVFIKAYQEEEWKTEDFYVSKDVYDLVNVGDMFAYDESRGDLNEEPYTKERKQEKGGADNV